MSKLSIKRCYGKENKAGVKEEVKGQSVNETLNIFSEHSSIIKSPGITPHLHSDQIIR